MILIHTCITNFCSKFSKFDQAYIMGFFPETFLRNCKRCVQATIDLHLTGNLYFPGRVIQLKA